MLWLSKLECLSGAFLVFSIQKDGSTVCIPLNLALGLKSLPGANMQTYLSGISGQVSQIVFPWIFKYFRYRLVGAPHARPTNIKLWVKRQAWDKHATAYLSGLSLIFWLGMLECSSSLSTYQQNPNQTDFKRLVGDEHSSLLVQQFLSQYFIQSQSFIGTKHSSLFLV